MTVAAGNKRVAANPSGGRKKAREEEDGVPKAKKEEEKAQKPATDLEEEIESVPSDLEEEEEVQEQSNTEAPEKKEYITKGCMLAQTVLEANETGKLNVIVSKEGKLSITIGAKGSLRGDMGPWVASLAYLRKFGTCHAPKPVVKPGEKQKFSMHTPIEDAWTAKHKIIINTNADAFEAMDSSNPNNGQVRADLARVESEWRDMMDVLSTRIINAIWEHPSYAPILRAQVTRMLKRTKNNREEAVECVKDEFKEKFLPPVSESGEDPPITLFVDRAAVTHSTAEKAKDKGPDYDPFTHTNWDTYFSEVWPTRSPIITTYSRPNKTQIELTEVASPSEGVYSYNEELVTGGTIVNINMLLTIGLKIDNGAVVPTISKKLTRADQAPVQILYRPPPGTRYSYKGDNGDENGAAAGGFVPEKTQSFEGHYGDSGI